MVVRNQISVLALIFPVYTTRWGDAVLFVHLPMWVYQNTKGLPPGHCT
jgi:hypothetical protein